MTPFERLIVLLEAEWHRLARLGQLSPALVDAAVDFLQAYADPCSRGPENTHPPANADAAPSPSAERTPPGTGLPQGGVPSPLSGQDGDGPPRSLFEQACAYALFRVLLGAQGHGALRAEPAADGRAASHAEVAQRPRDREGR